MSIQFRKARLENKMTLKHVAERVHISNSIIRLHPAEAQRLWLDKILELAIDAGMVS